ncbi:MAG: pyridoxal-phosphate dependent enzyme [Acidimicrobiia bacterium]|jgi:cysteine synthase
MIDLTLHEEPLARAAGRARERSIVVPTFAQMRDPALVPGEVVDRLRGVGLWDLDPLNLFRITWHNEPVAHGGGYGPVEIIEFPSELTGVPARILTLVGKWFPTGAHKVGAAFGCLVPELVTGGFDPTTQKAVWPSTGNYCRGGAYDANLLGCESVAILPEGMSRERFDWLRTVAGEIISTPGTESNVKEIFDECNRIRASGEDVVIFNQFEQFGNYLWHYSVTGSAMAEVLADHLQPGDEYRGVVLTTGSAGTIASGDLLKQRWPGSKIAAGEALQCPTLLYAGHGEHRIEGIGDKHVPWIHNVKNTDLVIAVDDEAPMSLIRVFNEPAGHDHLASVGVPDEIIARLPELGISAVANLVASVKFAKWYELGPHDVVLTMATDSMELYRSRLGELEAERGPLSTADARLAHERWLFGAGIDHMRELDHWQRRRIHDLKYFTWIEQQGRSSAELDAQWHDPGYWTSIQGQVDEIDRLIVEFNERVGTGG